MLRRELRELGDWDLVGGEIFLYLGELKKRFWNIFR